MEHSYHDQNVFKIGELIMLHEQHHSTSKKQTMSDSDVGRKDGAVKLRADIYQEKFGIDWLCIDLYYDASSRF